MLPWKHLLGTGWRWVRAGNAREAEKTKCRSPTRFLSSAGLPVFAGLFAQFRTLCQKQGVSSNGERTNVIPGDFLASSKVTAWFFFSMEICSQCSSPSPFPLLGHRCSVQPEQGSLPVDGLGKAGCAAIPPGNGFSAPSPALGGVFGGRINMSYPSDCTEGIFLILSTHT